MAVEYKLSYTGSQINEKLNKIDSLAAKSEIPTKVSDLENDRGFITGYTETDPTVPAWAKSANIEDAIGYTPANADDVATIYDSLFEEATVTHEVKGANIIPENMQWVEGYTIKNWSAGTTTMNDLNTASDAYTSEIIEVEPGVEYAMVNATGGASGRGAMGIYDANGVSIKYLKAADGNNIPVPSNGKYIRFTCNASQKSALVSIQPVDVSGQTWVSKVASQTEIVTETVMVDKIQLFEQSVSKRSRFIVFSDIHYNETSSAVAASDERMQLLVDSINAEHAKRTVDFCIFNGDIAIGYAKSSVEAFATKYLDKFKMPVFWFPGDHDDVNNANWVKIFGNQRQASLENSNFYFIWLDVYSDENDDGTESSGVRTSSTIDTAWVEQEIAKAGTKPVILLTHYVYCDTWYPEISNLLNNYPQIKAVISAHSHNNLVSAIGDNGATYIQTGNFSYPNGADWTKKGSDNEHLWGFANFETMDGGLYHWYIQPAHNYTNIGVDMPYTEGEKHLVLTMSSVKEGADINLAQHNKVCVSEDYIETDPTVPSWAKAANKPSYTASEVGAVGYTKQTLTEEQKSWARGNIGAASADSVASFSGNTNNATPAQVFQAMLEGRDVFITHTHETLGVLLFTSFIIADAMRMIVSSGVFALGSDVAVLQLLGNVADNTWNCSIIGIPQMSDIPTTLPNPNVLTFTGAVTGTYDGSSAKTINIPTIAGEAGADGYTPVKGVDYWTDADQESIVQQVIAALGTPVFGTVDADNNIILTGELADGTYTIKYEDAEGNQTTIGTLTAEGEPTYTNVLPLAIASDGTPYNGGQGWKTDTRLNSSGAESTSSATGVETTGFIPVKNGDVVYLSGVGLNLNESAGNSYIWLYDSSFTKLTGRYTRLGDESESSLASMQASGLIDRDTNGNITMMVIGDNNFFQTGNTFGDITSVAYLRFSAAEINTDSIITINQEITDDENSGTTYTNQIPISTDTDGSIYNGTGWKTGYRINSSGVITAQAGYEITGFIPFKKGDILRGNAGIIGKNISGLDSDTGYNAVSFFDASKTYIAKVDTKSNTTEAGVTIGSDDSFVFDSSLNTKVTDAVAFVRVTSVNITSSAIITVNQEIV